MKKIHLIVSPPNTHRYFLSKHGYFVFTSYISFTEYKTNLQIDIPWNNIGFIEDYEEK